MKSMPWLRSALVAASFAATAPAALAATITVNYAGAANFGSGAVGYHNGSIAPNPNSSTSLVAVGIGGINFTTSNLNYDFSATGRFNSWCVDIFHWLNGGTVNYNVGTGGDLALALSALRTNSATRVAQLGYLANEVYGSVDTKIESSAFQLAVWAIAYGTADGNGRYQINASDTGFRVDSATMNSSYGILANSWLTNLGTAADTGNYKLTYLNDGTVNNTQDQIVFTAVPEPATFALLAAGMFGLGWGRKKRL